MNIKKEIGNRIRQTRCKLEMTQRQFAAELDLSISTVSGYEIGDTSPSIDAAIKISRTGKVSLTWLLTGEQSETHEHPSIDLAPEELRLLAAFRSLTRINQAAILRITEGMQKHNVEGIA